MSKLPTELQVSAGGVVYRQCDQAIEVALISVGREARWQLPKGQVDSDESNESAAMREVREETGLETELVAFIDKIEYWYISKKQGRQVRFHKFVYFYLLHYKAGSVDNHDHEVNEARWVEIDQAYDLLAFVSEKKIMRQVKEMVSSPKDFSIHP
ncbi:MAG: NUDIX hydrolase [Anaerolineae bacterium]|nr:NUDIX hydrolase [Anaerolineae bacterium]